MQILVFNDVAALPSSSTEVDQLASDSLKSAIASLAGTARWRFWLRRRATFVALRTKNDEHLISFHSRTRFDLANIYQILLKLCQNARAQFPLQRDETARKALRLRVRKGDRMEVAQLRKPLESVLPAEEKCRPPKLDGRI